MLKCHELVLVVHPLKMLVHHVMNYLLCLVAKNLRIDFCLLHLTIGSRYLMIPRGPTNTTVLVIRKLFPEQKATFWTAIYLFIIHAWPFHDFLRFVQGFRQTMPFGQHVTMCYQIFFQSMHGWWSTGPCRLVVERWHRAEKSLHPRIEAS